MKKSRLFVATLALTAIATFGTIAKTYALRVLEYTWNCVGSGGNCLDTVVIPPDAN
jgi:hypothetical protein